MHWKRVGSCVVFTVAMVAPPLGAMKPPIKADLVELTDAPSWYDVNDSITMASTTAEFSDGESRD